MFAFPRPDLIKILEEALSVVAGIQMTVSPEQRPTEIRPESHQGCRRVAVAVGQNPAEMKIEEFSASRQFSFTFGLAKIGCEQHRPTLPTRDHGIRRKSLDTAKTALCGIKATRSATYWTQQMVSIPIKAAYVILSQYRHQIIRNQQTIAQNLLSK